MEVGGSRGDRGEIGKEGEGPGRGEKKGYSPLYPCT